jgi:hypothetical protein
MKGFNMQSHSGSSKTAFMAGFAALTIGAVAWSGHLFALLALLTLPMVFTSTKAPAQRLTVLVCYYAASIWPVMPGATQFFGDNAGLHPLSILILWLISSLVLTLPWVWLLLTPGIKAEWALPVGLCLTALLPTGVVNPLTVAGVLFPGLGWAGLIATIILFGTLSKFRLYSILSAAMLAAICYVSHPGIPTVSPTWQGHDTELGGSELSKQTPMALYKAVVYVQETAFDSNAPIQVFPEGIINHWTPSAEGFWQSTYSELQQNHQSILFGAEEYGPHGGQYRNELLLRGQYTATFQQRVPIPYAMWRPWDNIGVPIHYFGPSILSVGPRRAAPIICYEQLLVAPILMSIEHNPDVIVSVANDYWTKGTYIAEIQQSAIEAWSRLFWIPVVSATNR